MSGDFPRSKNKRDYGDFQVIRWTIEDFYLNLKIVEQNIKDEMDLKYGYKKNLAFVGFYDQEDSFGACQNKRKLLIERLIIFHWR